MAFPGELTLVDNFNRTDGPIHAGAGSTIWQNLTLGGGSGVMIVTGNQAATGTGGAGSVTALSEADLLHVFTVSSIGSGGYISYFFRLQSAGASTWSGYWFLAQGGNFSLHKRVGGVITQLTAVAANSLSDSDKLGVRAYGHLLELYRQSGGIWANLITYTDSATDAILTSGPGYFELEQTSARIDDFMSGDPALAVPTTPVTLYVDADNVAASDSITRTTGSNSATPFFSVQAACAVAYATPTWADTVLVKPATAADPANIDPAIYKAVDHLYLRAVEYPAGLQFGDNSGNLPITVIGDSFNSGQKAKLAGINGRRLKNWVFEGFQVAYDRGSGNDSATLSSLQSCEDLTFRRFHWTGGAAGFDAWTGTILVEDSEVNAPLGPPSAFHSGRGFGFSSESAFSGATTAWGDITIRRTTFDGVRGDDAIQVGMVADPTGQSGTVLIEDCLFHDVTENGPGGDITFHTDSLQILGVPTTIVRRNAFIGCSDALMASDFHNGTITFENNLAIASGGLVQIQGTDNLVMRHNTILATRGSLGEDATVIFFHRLTLPAPILVTIENNIVGGISLQDPQGFRSGSVIRNNIETHFPGRDWGFGTNLIGTPEFGTSARMSNLPTSTIGGWGTIPANYELANSPTSSPGIGQGVASSITSDRLGRAYSSPPDVGCHQSSPGTPVTPVARPPYVIARSPGAGAVDIAKDASITVTLYPKPGNTINAATVSNSTFDLLDPAGVSIPTSSVVLGALASGAQTITMDVNGDLYPYVVYTVRLEQPVADSEGNALDAAVTWTFRVLGPHPFPAVGNSGVVGPDPPGPISGYYYAGNVDPQARFDAFGMLRDDGSLLVMRKGTTTSLSVAEASRARNYIILTPA